MTMETSSETSGETGSSNVADRDVFEGALDEAAESLHIRIGGPDRPSLISEAATRLEGCALYIESITFNLTLPNEHRYVMEIMARGELDSLRRMQRRIDADKFFEGAARDTDEQFHWPSCSMLHLGVDTPDEPGLTAKLARIVAEPRDTGGQKVCPRGSIVHLIGITHNSGGPHGGTAYFNLRANIASQTRGIQDQIASHVRAWAEKHGRGDDVWTRDLNRNDE